MSGNIILLVIDFHLKSIFIAQYIDCYADNNINGIRDLPYMSIGNSIYLNIDVCLDSCR